MDNTRAEQLRAALNEFLATKTTRPKDLITLHKFLTYKPKYTHPANLVEMDEFETRVDFLQDVQKSIHLIQPDWRATAVHLAIFMVMPMDRVDKLKGLLEYTDPESWMNELEKMVWLMRQFFQKSMASYEHDFLAQADNVPSMSRDPEEEKVCLERERNVCLATGMGLPGVCHIVPFAFGANDADAIATREMVLGSCKFLGDSRAVGELLGQHPGSSDKAWNMLTLNHLTRKWWNMGLFALKCLGVTQGDSLATIQLQFHWMARPSNNPNPHREVDLEDREAVYQDIARLSKPPSIPSDEGRRSIGIPRAESVRPVRSGDLLEIRMPFNEALKMKSMIDLQWTMISCMALSGAAGSPELLYEQGQPDDDVFQTHDAQEDPRESCSPGRSGSVQDLPIREHPGSPQHQRLVDEDDASTDKQTTLGSPWFDVSRAPQSSLSESDGEAMSPLASDFVDCEWGRSVSP